MTSTSTPSTIELSVVIPSHNRCASLSDLLDALSRQGLPPERFEIIVVLDGSTDGSAEFLARWARDHPRSALRVIEQPNQGQSAARSRGVAEAAAPLLLFLDDDVVPEPGCLAAHLVRHQQSRQPVAVLGEAQMAMAKQESYYDMLTRMWWEDAHAQRSRRHPHSSYRDFCAGHVSVPREVFLEVGGFDADFRGYGGEDYELGYRLLQAGVRFDPAPEAKAIHHHRGSSRQVLRNLMEEGRNDVRLGRKHPALRRGLRCAKRSAPTRAVFLAPGLFRLGLLGLSVVLRACERLGSWRAWRWLLGKARFVAYWIGVSRAFPNWRGFCAYLDAAPPLPRRVLDISDGLPADLSSVWMQGPSVLEVRANGRQIGQVHLEAMPEGSLAEHLAEMLIAQSVLPPVPAPPQM